MNIIIEIITLIVGVVVVLVGWYLQYVWKPKKDEELKRKKEAERATLTPQPPPPPGGQETDDQKPTPVRTDPDKIYLSKLPITGHDLFGRDSELSILDKAWSNPHTYILTLVAWGGVGKTALVNEWLNRMETENYRGAKRVYGWSFYSQGTREDRQASADEFFVDALKWFGDTEEPPKSQWEKGRRLATLVREQKTLLILDGMEPLQYPPGEMHGRLKDQGLQALLRELSHSNPGLCVLTTRVEVKDIENCVGTTVNRINLEHLSEDAGAQLLSNLDVKGTPAELREASKEFGGHALALNLLGTYLATVHDGEIRKRDLIPKLTDEEEKSGHAQRVMESYERWLEGKPELNILYLMGLFDRPASGGAIKKLREEPPIEGLTDKLQTLTPAQWQYALKHLRDLRLLGEKDKNRPDTLDSHPLVREHFAEKLRENNPKAWKEAHSRLYGYYKNLPEKELPDTLEEMEPLFAAVAHGCRAGRHQEALDDVFWPRISRRGEAYTVRKLGAFGADLAALSGFFEIPWSKPASGLTDVAKLFVLSRTGFCLRALGRLREAAQPMKAAVENLKIQENWKEAAANTNNLSELHLTLGDVMQAVDHARQSVEFADRSGEWEEKMTMRTTLADALHYAGEPEEAEELFLEAEAIQKEYQPEYPCIYSVAGFRFCDLLLGLGRYREVEERAEKALYIVLHGSRNLLDIALNNLSLGRALMPQAQKEGNSDNTRAGDHLNQAVEGLRESGYKYYLPSGLLARAALYRLQKEFTKAWNDLEEAREIAERGGMKLHLADYHLEACRVCIAEGKKEEAREHLEKAKKMIGDAGYHRRDGELGELEEQPGERNRGGGSGGGIRKYS